MNRNSARIDCHRALGYSGDFAWNPKSLPAFVEPF